MTNTSSGDLPDEIAPDGSEVRHLARTDRGSMAEFRLPAGATTQAVVHRTVDELWFVASGSGELWRRSDVGEAVTVLPAGASVSIVCGTSFQFRNVAADDLRIVGVTMPPWPGDDEAIVVENYWPTD